MARNTFYRITISIEWETLCPQRYSLIYFHIIANYTGLSYDNTRSVVYCKAAPYLCSRMNIYSCLAVGKLGDYTRNKRHSRFVQLMRHTVVAHCLNHRITAYNLSKACSGRVAIVCSLNVKSKLGTQLRQIIDKRQCNLSGTLRGILNYCCSQREARLYLLAQKFIDALNHHSRTIAHCVVAKC